MEGTVVFGDTVELCDGVVGGFVIGELVLLSVGSVTFLVVGEN